MLSVLIAGAGKSSAHLIDYMLQNAKQKWRVVVMDSNPDMIASKLNNHPKGKGVALDIKKDEELRQRLVSESDIVISLMPPDLHYLLAKDCIKFKKNLITSSYVSDKIKELDAAAKEAGVMMMCEMGLDPGIDHMSANAIIHGVQRIAGSIISFKSYCGGLVAPESDDNPWHYKISWNPRNILLAGKQGAAWLENDKHHELAYEQLFTGFKKIKVHGLGNLAYYPNRDSLKYLDLYDLQEVKTFMRATLRHPAFMKGWGVIVAAGLVDEQDAFEVEGHTYLDWIAWKIGAKSTKGLMERFVKKFEVEDKECAQLEWLGLFDPMKIKGKGKMSSADILQTLIESKWKMEHEDKDMVVMQHQIEYERKGAIVKLISNMTVVGENRQMSAMSKTVGLPMAILAKKLLLQELTTKNITGVRIPVMPEVYVPLLKELKKHGVEFNETIE